MSAFSVDEIDALFGDGPERAGARAQARAALAEQQSKWDALDERLGYSRAKHAERSAVAGRDERAHALSAKPARSAGVAAKLHAILCMGREDCPDNEFPGRRSALFSGISSRALTTCGMNCEAVIAALPLATT